MVYQYIYIIIYRMYIIYGISIYIYTIIYRMYIYIYWKHVDWLLQTESDSFRDLLGILILGFCRYDDVGLKTPPHSHGHWSFQSQDVHGFNFKQTLITLTYMFILSKYVHERSVGATDTITLPGHLYLTQCIFHLKQGCPSQTALMTHDIHYNTN